LGFAEGRRLFGQLIDPGAAHCVHGVTQEAAIRKPDASEFLALPYFTWLSRPDTIPLDVEEAATALFLKNGDVGKAAERLKVTVARLNKTIGKSPGLQRLITALQQTADDREKSANS
jgi:hypothetical protein